MARVKRNPHTGAKFTDAIISGAGFVAGSTLAVFVGRKVLNSRRRQTLQNPVIACSVCERPIVGAEMNPGYCSGCGSLVGVIERNPVRTSSDITARKRDRFQLPKR